jgi:hypothetical protein
MTFSSPSLARVPCGHQEPGVCAIIQRQSLYLSAPPLPMQHPLHYPRDNLGSAVSNHTPWTTCVPFPLLREAPLLGPGWCNPITLFGAAPGAKSRISKDGRNQVTH